VLPRHRAVYIELIGGKQAELGLAMRPIVLAQPGAA